VWILKVDLFLFTSRRHMGKWR